MKECVEEMKKEERQKRQRALYATETDQGQELVRLQPLLLSQPSKLLRTENHLTTGVFMVFSVPRSRRPLLYIESVIS